MANPLFKRIPRELKTDFSKYVALFLFIVLVISFCSGFIVAGQSMRQAFDESFDKYTVEDGHFVTAMPVDADTYSDVTIHNLFYKDRITENEHSIRIYKNRDAVNNLCIMEGENADEADEIVIDRLYAVNNSFKIGDKIKLDDKELTICGLAAFSDYTSLFKNNNDMMFDAKCFTVATVTDDTFESIGSAGLKFCYAWTNNDKSLSEDERNTLSENLMKNLIANGAIITDFVPREFNQAIMFTGDDMGSDQLMIQWLLYIVVVVLAFIFAVTIRSTIEQEASAIGTLRASGYTKAEMFVHYLTLPMIIMLTAAIAGNILGYTVMKNFVKGIYYNSYSLPTFETVWSTEAFVKTTIIPCLIIIAINVVVLLKALSLSPLQLLRREFSKKKNKKAVKLPDLKFISRFRLRVILQNMSAYLTMFAGIFFAGVLLMFGMMFPPLLNNYKDEVSHSKIADYQYILKAPFEVENESVEKYCVTSLTTENGEEITVYGVEDNSAYVKNIDFEKNGIDLSEGFCEKYKLEKGDSITLYNDYENKEYTFKVNAQYSYPPALSLFMSIDTFREMFEVSDSEYSGYFSNEKLDIPNTMIATLITEHDLSVVATQLETSLGMVFSLFAGFAVIVYIIVMYLLAKIIIERNAYSISMLKILGFADMDISKIYNTASAVVAVASILISSIISGTVIKLIYNLMMFKMAGWLTFYLSPWIYPAILAIGCACYFIIYLILYRKIKKIPLGVALKNKE